MQAFCHPTNPVHAGTGFYFRAVLACDLVVLICNNSDMVRNILMRYVSSGLLTYEPDQGWFVVPMATYAQAALYFFAHPPCRLRFPLSRRS
jgi:hypothetical protein